LLKELSRGVRVNKEEERIHSPEFDEAYQSVKHDLKMLKLISYACYFLGGIGVVCAIFFM
jgi:hypothetical protein